MKTNLPPKFWRTRGRSSGFSLWGKHQPKLARQRGFMEVDMMVGIAILTLAVLPLAYTFVRERQVLRIEYCRSVADEIVDGEMEILMAGAAKNLPDGPQAYSVNARAASQLPRGHFQLTKTGNHLRLEWTPDVRRGFAAVVREATLK
jgi:hypothetical protein